MEEAYLNYFYLDPIPGCQRDPEVQGELVVAPLPPLPSRALPFHSRRQTGEKYILLGPVRPPRSGGSGPAGRWPGRSAGPEAGAAAAHWRAAGCSSWSLRGDAHEPELPPWG